jgi:phosphoserine aminotransferase
MTALYNFGAGPAMLPREILLDVQAELLDWNNQGMSILEIGHRTAPFQNLMQQLEDDLRDLLAIPENYSVLFLGGAARANFALIPMNLITPGQVGAYCVSGVWSKMAYTECAKLSRAYCVSSSEADGFNHAPYEMSQPLNHNTAYVYYTPNETINGVRFAQKPLHGEFPLVADMTSCLLSEPIQIEDYGLIFAGAQKNIAPAGLTIVIVRNDLLDRKPETCIPTMFDYRTHVAHKSLYATPPTFNCYFAAKMFQWIKKQGGISTIYQQNCEKSALLYDFIDTSVLYKCAIEKSSRSLMNVCFSLIRAELESDFLTKALEHGLYGLQGHRMVGGLRASIYNAMPMSGVQKLIEFMREYEESVASEV